MMGMTMGEEKGESGEGSRCNNDSSSGSSRRKVKPTIDVAIAQGSQGQEMQQAKEGLARVMSKSSNDFDDKYEILDEIGKGGFSKVHRCRSRSSGQIFAVKVIDLQPLRLQQRFNPERLRREVDIMRELSHPAIIQFVDVFEEPKSLQIVMEYAPGSELFDLILARKYYSEVDARPIFGQVTQALQYLHSQNIIHRDVKPENVLILDQPGPDGGTVAKLLDFGLSKHLNSSSAGAKTFVGTPCYLAPEVEYTSKGKGGTYGVSADCWSLGAVLHVMLVARFPEWEVVNQQPKLSFDKTLWSGVSTDAMDLITRLMEPNPTTRLSTRDVLNHPWMRGYNGKQPASAPIMPPSPLKLPTGHMERYDSIEEVRPQYVLADGPPHGHSRLGAPAPMSATASSSSAQSSSGGGVEVGVRSLAVDVYDKRVTPLGGVGPNGTGQVQLSQLPLAPLMDLQTGIANCFDELHLSYSQRGMSEVASQVRRGAVLCRAQLLQSTKMIRHVEQTASMVLEMFPDFELAIEAGEPALAVCFFNMVRDWVSDLKTAVLKTQDANRESVEQIQGIVEDSTSKMFREQTDYQSKKEVQERLQDKLANIKKSMTMEEGIGGNVDSEKFFSLFDVMTEAIDGITSEQSPPPSHSNSGVDMGSMDVDAAGAIESPPSSSPHGSGANSPHGARGGSDESAGLDLVASTASSPIRNIPIDSRLDDALQQLRQVDLILEQLGIFWANTEVVLEMLTKKGQRAEQFVGFGNKPQLMNRFRQLMNDYGRFWSGVKTMCHNYIHGAELDANLDTNANVETDSTPSTGSGNGNHPRADSPSMSSYDFTGVDDSRERFLDRSASLASTPPRNPARKNAQQGSGSGQMPPVSPGPERRNSRGVRDASPDPLVVQMSQSDDLQKMTAEWVKSHSPGSN
jgi:serine/threonine protein kinase